MIPDYWGPCWSLQCPKCGQAQFFTVDRPFGRKLETTRFTYCPGCGFSEVPIRSVPLKEGESVRLWPRFLSFGRPERWEAVAFDRSDGKRGKAAFDLADGERTLGFKRVVGLPGETVEIDRGDLRVNGRIATKKSLGFARVPLRTIRPVRQADRVLFQNLPPKPFLEGEEPGEAIPTPITNIPQAGRVEPIPIDRVENVRDFILEFPLTYWPTSRPLKILVNQGDRFWLAVIDRQADRVILYQRRNSEPERCEEAFAALSDGSFPSESARTVSFGGKTDYMGYLSLAFCDRQAVLRIRGDLWETELARIPEDSDVRPAAAEKNPPITTPFAILIGEPNDRQGGIAPTPDQLGAFRFFRDIHYSVPKEGGSKWTLGDDEYLLLGDNSAVSIDARDWNPPGVRRDRIRRIRHGVP